MNNPPNDSDGVATQFDDGLTIEVTPPRRFAGLIFTIGFGPHLDHTYVTPLMISKPPSGGRQLISDADALLIAQISSFARPKLGEPPLDTHKEDQDAD